MTNSFKLYFKFRELKETWLLTQHIQMFKVTLAYISVILHIVQQTFRQNIFDMHLKKYFPC